MPTPTYITRRDSLETYFDRTAVEAWSKLTSDAPVSGIRATVRAGRDRMRATLLSWLPEEMRGARLLDAGCGTGSLSVEAAKRGASVVGVDISPKLIELAKERAPAELAHQLDFRAGDMLDQGLGRFDFCVAMDSLIHYRSPDLVRVLASLGRQTDRKIVFTFAPKTLALTAMWTAGKLFPRSDRSPSIEPVVASSLSKRIAAENGLQSWQIARSVRIVNGFYTSQAMELLSS